MNDHPQSTRDTDPPTSSPSPGPVRPRPSGLGWKAPLLVGAIVLVAAGTAYFVFLGDGAGPSRPATSQPDRRISVAVFPFLAPAESEEIQWYGQAVSEFLYLALEESSSLRVLTPERLHQLGFQKTVVEPRELAHRGGADYFLHGEVSGNPESITLTGIWSDATTGEELNRWILEEINEETLGVKLDDFCQRIREELDLPDPSPSEPPLASLVPVRATPTQSYVEASALLAAGDADGSLERLQVALELADFHLAQYLRAAAAAQTGNRAEVQAAARHLSGLSRPMPIRVRLFVPALSALYEEGGSVGAVPLLETLLTRFPEEFQPLLWLGALELNRPQGLERALDYLDRARALSPSHPQLQALLGRAKFRAGDYDEAVEYLDTALREDPENPEIRLNLAQALAAAGRSQEAESRLRKILAENPEDLSIVEGLGHVLLSGNQVQAALDLYRGLLDSPAPQVRATGELFMGRTQLLQGHFQQGMERYRKAMELASETGDLATQANYQMELGEVQASLGQYDEALTTLSTVREIGARVDPDFAIVAVLVAQKRTEEARQLFETQVDRWQAQLSPAVLGRLRDSLEGTIALEEDRFSDAITYLEAALPGGVGEGIHDFEPLARAYLGAGEVERARAVFQKMSESPRRLARPIRFVKGLINLGKAQEKLGERDLARETYREALHWWGNADIPLPEITRAREAFDRLNQ